MTIPFSTGLTAPYMLDQGSVLAAESLRLPDVGIVLDTCAASGGKSLANEPSRERWRRLVTVLDEHLESEKRSRVRVSGFDAAILGKGGD